MISVQQAIGLVKNNLPERKIEVVNLVNSLGYVLVQEIYATIPSPPYTNSGMDGFAVFWNDVRWTSPENPVNLKISGESAAGQPFQKKIESGSAIRISTGAILPQDMDCIIPIENCRVDETSVEIFSAKKQFQHIRFQGEEYKKDDLLLTPGTKIGSAQIALIASQGISKIKVYKKARVTILSTGSELIPYDQKAAPNQILDSNSPMLSAAVEEARGIVDHIVHVKDDPQLTQKAIMDAADATDIIISTGGVSMGEHDHVRNIALQMDFKEIFWKIRQKPGKPMFLARKKNTLLIALPGNPVSSFMCFKHYVRPLLQSISGHQFTWPKIKARLSDETINHGDRTLLLRVKIDENGENTVLARPLNRQGSHMPSSIAHADGYIIVPENSSIKKEEYVEVFLF